MKIICALFLVLFAFVSQAGNVTALSYSGTNVTTGAYVTLVASTPGHVSKLLLCDTSGQVLKIAVGAAASEVDLATMPVSSCLSVALPVVLKSGSRLSLKAISASATTGYATVSFLE